MFETDTPTEIAPQPGRFRRTRNYFLTGLIICAPLAITAYLTWSFIQWVDGWVKPLVPASYNPETYLPFSIPGFGLLIAFVFITLVGFITANYVGRSIVGFGEQLLARMPVVRNLYSGLKQIFETVLSERSNSFQKVALLEYPRRGLWAIVFISTKTGSEVAYRLRGEAQSFTSVFLPTTPNPTSGFLLFVPTNDLIELKMTVEEGAKLVISAGLVAPDSEDPEDGSPAEIAARREGIDLAAETARRETEEA
ncbi:MAG: DUF502 domain-containing protein [Pseudomonadota bacterium]